MAGITQQSAANEIGVIVRTYQKYESGDIEPPLSALVSLAIIFNVPTDYLLGLADEALFD